MLVVGFQRGRALLGLGLGREAFLVAGLEGERLDVFGLAAAGA